MKYFNTKCHLELASCVFQPLFGYLCIAFELSISLHYASLKLTESDISGIGLATTIVNLIVLAIGHGFNQSLNVNVAQALGSNNTELALKYLNTTLYTHVLVNTILGVIIYYSMGICHLFINNDSQQVINTAKHYSVFVILAAQLFNIYEACKLFMIANKRVAPFKYIHVITTLSHIFWCYLSTIIFDMKVTGLGLSIIISQTLNILLLKLYIFLYSSDIFKGFTFKFILISQFRFYIDYLYISIANLIHQLADYFIFIVLNVIAYILSNSEVNAQISLTNTFGIYYKLPLCTAIAIQTFVGHELSKGEIEKAKQYGIIGLIQFTVFLILLLIFNWIFRNEWAHFFTTQDDVISQLLETLPYLLLGCVTFDGYQGCLAAILKGAEKVDTVSMAAIVGYYVIGIPLIIYLIFHLNMGLKGIWIGFGFASFLLLVYYIYEIWNINWEVQKNIILEKLFLSKNLIQKA